jgi:Ser/Thr protein kinase RdoA (MazF antagonist)
LSADPHPRAGKLVSEEISRTTLKYQLENLQLASHKCNQKRYEIDSRPMWEDREVEGMDAAVLSPVLPLGLHARSQNRSRNATLDARDVLSSTFSNAGLRKFCYPHYDLDRSTRCTLFKRNLNDVYLLTAPGQRYAVKVYQSEWRSRAAILSEVEAIRHLAAKGVEVALPIARKDGRWITELPAPEGRRSAVLFQWVDGEAARWTDPSHAAQLGNLAARMHSAADEMSFHGPRPQMTIDHLMGDSLARIRRAVEGSSLLERRCEAIVKRCRASLRRAKAQPGDWGFCHGDLYLSNARIKADKLVLLDFDWCGFSWRVFELATFRWASRWFNAESSAWKPFIEAYLQVRPSAESSLEFLRLFMVLRHLWIIAQWIRTAGMAGEYMIADGRLDELISKCEQIEGDPDLSY